MSTAAARITRGVLAALIVSVAPLVAPPASASTLATLELSTDRARPGDEVSFRGWYYNDVKPVIVRWGGLDGPVLATVTPDTFGVVHNHFRSMAGTFRVPTDAPPGTHVLLATQDFAPPGKITWGVPARAELRVGDVPPAAVPPAIRRPQAVATSAIPDGPALVVAGVAGAALAGLLVVLAVVLRRRRAPS